MASLSGGLSDKSLACAFVSALPEGVHQLLRAGSRMEMLKLDQIFTRARAVVKDACALGIAGMCLGAKVSGAELCATTSSL